MSENVREGKLRRNTCGKRFSIGSRKTKKMAKMNALGVENFTANVFDLLLYFFLP